MEFFDSEIVEVRKLTHNTNSYLLRFADKKHINYKAGQWVMLKANIDGEEVKKPYSIASPPLLDMEHAEYMELIIKHVPGGKMTDYLFSIDAGTHIGVAGPFGKFILLEPIKEGDIFMATGSGLAPFMAMLRKVFRDHNPKEFYLFFGAINEREIIYADELVRWDKEHKNFHLVVCLSKPSRKWDGEIGYVQDKITNYIKDFKNKQAYLCGLPMMVEQAKQRLLELGVKKENIFQELY